jgi:tRNA uridine 5-carboxymethylaminomethyl modification enzyme
LPERNYRKFAAKREAIEAEIQRLQKTREGADPLIQILRRPEVGYKDLPGRDSRLPADVVEQVEIHAKYAGYISRQENEVARFKTLEEKQIPPQFDYMEVPSLRAEARQKLMKIRPTTVGQAARISGVSPSDISIILVWLKRGSEASEVMANGK